MIRERTEFETFKNVRPEWVRLLRASTGVVAQSNSRIAILALTRFPFRGCIDVAELWRTCIQLKRTSYPEKQLHRYRASQVLSMFLNRYRP